MCNGNFLYCVFFGLVFPPGRYTYVVIYIYIHISQQAYMVVCLFTCDFETRSTFPQSRIVMRYCKAFVDSIGFHLVTHCYIDIYPTRSPSSRSSNFRSQPSDKNAFKPKITLKYIKGHETCANETGGAW